MQRKWGLLVAFSSPDTYIFLTGVGVDGKTVIARLEADGWYEVGQKVSHKQFRHPIEVAVDRDPSGRVTIPHPNKDLAIGALKRIGRQATLGLRR